jgi:hypothetical protein
VADRHSGEIADQITISNATPTFVRFGTGMSGSYVEWSVEQVHPQAAMAEIKRRHYQAPQKTKLDKLGAAKCK